MHSFWVFGAFIHMTLNQTQPAEKLLRARQVLDLLGVSRSLFYRWLQAGIVPQGTLISARVRVWKQSDINALIQRLTQPRAKQS